MTARVLSQSILMSVGIMVSLFASCDGAGESPSTAQLFQEELESYRQEADADWLTLDSVFGRLDGQNEHVAVLLTVGPDHPADVRLRVFERRGDTLRPLLDTDIDPLPIPAGLNWVRMADGDGDGDDELFVRWDCSFRRDCHFLDVFDAQDHEIRRVPTNGASRIVGDDIADLNNDGAIEIIAFDYGFSYWTAFPDNRSPLSYPRPRVVLDWEGGRFRPAFGDFSSFYQGELAEAHSSLEREAKDADMLVAWAIQILYYEIQLRDCEEGWTEYLNLVEASQLGSEDLRGRITDINSKISELTTQRFGCAAR